ncbi:response regulator [Cohnella faecalis]|uniref:Response regulator n=1 Tax=Cohnella faecalis TaxID=2315694 RepID=A0A398CV01_9BACL|nr:response regulator [Cohnella faecalis]RIE05099.1 response regulator [Cohnella faecalis]
MRNVMIVDDESLVRIGLQSMIDWESRGYRITGVFKNGEEALAAATRQPFDVVLTDIRMPGMDGFELIRELRKLSPSLHVIVLSSYNDFEYTRQAIQLGVKDYISKYEMEPDELLRVLASLSFASRQEAVDKPFAVPQVPIAEEAKRLLGGREQEEGVVSALAYPNLARTLTGSGDAFRWIALLPYPREAGYSSAERKAMLLLAEEMFSRLRNPVLFGESDGCLHGGYACDSDGGFPGSREECLRMADEWTSAFSQKLNVALAAGFGTPTALSGSWTAARREAEEAVAVSLFDGGVQFREAVGERRAFTEDEWLKMYKQIKQRVRYMQFRLLSDDLTGFMDEHLDRYKPSEWIRLGVAAVSQLTDFLIERYDLETVELRERFGSLWPLDESAGAVRSAAAWRSMLHDVSVRTQEVVAHRQAKGGWVERVKIYLEAHYGEQIRLEDIAQLANFSESHFSQRFRQETGQVFSDYLTDLRIAKAVQLFRNTGLSTEEIAERVGYSNPNYFIKVFKRKTGQTVKNFKSTR